MLKAKRNLITLILTAMVMSTVLGCSKSTTTPNTNNTDNATKPELKALLVYQSGMDFNNYPVQKFLEEKTGYKVVYDSLPQDNSGDKLNLIIASGQEYDYIRIFDKSRYANYAQQGALNELEELVKKYGANISKNIDSATFDSLRINGKYYGIPIYNPSGREDSTNITNGILVRQDWLDKLSLKLPRTTDEFTNMLQQFKDKDPNGNGANNIPIALDSTLNLMDYGIGGAFGISTFWTEVNGKLVPRVEMPGFKEYILYLKELYVKGLIDKEAPTNQGSTAKEKFTSGKAGAFLTGWFDMPTIGDTFAKTQPNAKTTFLPPVSGKLGKATLPANDLKNAIESIVVVPKSSKHPEDVMKYFNLKMEEETFKEMVIGKENVTYTVKDGGYFPILPAFFDQRGNANTYLTGATKDYGKYWLARLRKDDRLYKGWKELNVDYNDAVVIDVVSKAPILPISQKYSDALGKLTSDFILKSVVGDFSDTTLKAFLADWKSQGGEESVKEVNNWYSTAKK